MKTGGFTHHVEIADVMSGVELHKTFVEAVEAKFTEIPVQLSFRFTDGCDAVMYPNDKAQPAEDAEVEFLQSCETYAYEVMTLLARVLPVEILILHGDDLIKLKFALHQYFEDFTENDGNDQAFKIAEDHAQDMACAEADHRLDDLKDRRLEQVWDE